MRTTAFLRENASRGGRTGARRVTPSFPLTTVFTRAAVEFPCLYKNANDAILAGMCCTQRAGAWRVLLHSPCPLFSTRPAHVAPPAPSSYHVHEILTVPNVCSVRASGARKDEHTPRMGSLCPHVSPSRTYPPFRLSKASALPFRNRPAQK